MSRPTLECCYVGDERRQATRHRVFIPIRMDGRRDTQVGKVTSGMTRDVSAEGLLVRTRRQFTIGAAVTLSVQLDRKETWARQLQGTVVRMTDNRADPDGLWPFEVAIQLDRPEPALAHAGQLLDEG